jgi:NADPH-dependent curcumin reductase CurA
VFAVPVHRVPAPATLGRDSTPLCEDVLDGIERMPEGFLRLLSGKNFGKQILKIV